MTPKENRAVGCLVGLAVGDAVGTALEFKPPGTFQPIDDMVGGGPFNLPVGAWTDDTSMALCLAESLVECGGFDPVDQLQRYVLWWKKGHWSSTGSCFDIGGTTSSALARFEATGKPYCGSTSPRSAGNGSIMRLAPVPMYYAEQPAEAVDRSRESSRTTHGAEEAVDACRYFGSLLVGALNGVDKSDLLAARHGHDPSYWKDRGLSPKIDEVAKGSFKHRKPPEIQGRGYVVLSLEAALWAFHNTDNFRDGLLLAVNLGNDADTTGAVYGQIAGAHYGYSGIPEGWREKIVKATEIVELAQKIVRERP